MFGWEFPPHIAGGLGTACYGMTRGLARNGVDVTFVPYGTTSLLGKGLGIYGCDSRNVEHTTLDTLLDR